MTYRFQFLSEKHTLFVAVCAVAFNFHMNAVLYQLAEKVPFHVGFHDAACKVHGEDILETDDGTVGTGRKRLSHVNIKTLDIGFHIVRNVEGAHVGQPGGGIFVLHSRVEGADHKVFDKQRHHPDQKIVLCGGVGCDIAAQEFLVYISRPKVCISHFP